MTETSDSVLDALTTYVAEEILEGDDEHLDATTPLLDLGVLNSIEVQKLAVFICERFGVAVPPRELTTGNLETLHAATAMVLRLRQAAAPAAGNS